jgi:F-type H+-transporting ATPase subunit delta
MLRTLATRATRVAGRRAFQSSSRVLAEDAAEGAEATKVTLNFAVPHQAIYESTEVDLVIVPGVTGEYGVTAGHTPIISELKPGLVQIFHDENDEPEKYFVSGGFSFTHANSVTDLSAVEAVKLEDLDEDAVRSGLSSFKAAMDAATPETQDHALAQIGFEVHEAMCDALGITASA